MIRSHTPTILVIDDEADLRALYTTALSRRGWQVVLAANVAQAIQCIVDHPEIQAIISDMRLPDGSGIDVLQYVRNHASHLPSLVITAFGGVSGEGGAVEAMKAGAFDYLSKPVDLALLRERVSQMLQAQNKVISAHPARTLANLQPPSLAIKILLPGDSAAMEQVQNQLLQWAKTQAPVVISGESGTGKELAARALHRLSTRADRPFFAVNCGAIPESLMEAEFFGVRKGAFTGAQSDREGFFHAANGGTLLLDEVADLPLAMQVKLLRVLQERRVRRVGGNEEEAIDVRIIAASHKDLATLVALGHFRQDLFYRLDVMHLNMPALRERGQDIVSIALRWLGVQTEGAALELSAQAQAWLLVQPFPGNVRELENMLERAVAHCTALGISEISIAQLQDTPSNLPSVPTTGLQAFPTLAGQSELKLGAAVLPLDLNAHLSNIERTIIEQALLQARYNRSAAAELLGLSLRQLRYRIDQLSIE